MSYLLVLIFVIIISITVPIVLALTIKSSTKLPPGPSPSPGPSPAPAPSPGPSPAPGPSPSPAPAPGPSPSPAPSPAPGPPFNQPKLCRAGLMNNIPGSSLCGSCDCKKSLNAQMSCDELNKSILIDVRQVKCNTSDPTGMNDNYKNDCDTYTQYWSYYNVKNPATGKSKWRASAMAVPKCQVCPDDGWPVVMYFEFMNSYGYAEGWKSNKPGGLQPIGLTTKSADSAWTTIQATLMGLTSLGYAVLMTSEWVSDAYFYANCNSPDPENICWNDGKNPDLSYFNILFSKLYNNELTADKVKFDYNRFGMIGYSVGSQMVSRCINDFPNLKTSDSIPFPKISAGVMIGGGTLGCYNDTVNLAPCCIQSTDPENCAGRCVKEGKPCSNYCCPVGKSEPNYDNGSLKWSEHPAMLLLQTKYDMYADTLAWSKYFDTVNSNSNDTVDMYAIIAGKNLHGLCPCQVNPLLNFIKHYV